VFEESFLYEEGGLKSCERDINIHRENVLYNNKKHHLSKLTQAVEDKEKEVCLMNGIQELRKEIRKLNATIFSKKCEMWDNERQIEKLIQKRKQIENITYKQLCPIEDCGGLLDGVNTCEKCKVIVCGDCNCVKVDDNHICDENLKLNLKEIKENTTPCPKCRTRIHKIAYCDDMFCVVCRTKFNYTTGEIISRAIHNPHQTETSANLDECNPVDIPTFDMMKSIDFITTKQRKHLLDIFSDTDSNINTITQEIFSINDNDGKSYFVEELRGKLPRYTKRDLLKDFKMVKIMLVIRDNLMTYRTLLIEAYWALYESKDLCKSEEILRSIVEYIRLNNENNAKFSYDRRYKNYTEISYDERHFIETLPP
jgi:hypothetical protein